MCTLLSEWVHRYTWTPLFVWIEILPQLLVALGSLCKARNGNICVGGRPTCSMRICIAVLPGRNAYAAVNYGHKQMIQCAHSLRWISPLREKNPIKMLFCNIQVSMVTGLFKRKCICQRRCKTSSWRRKDFCLLWPVCRPEHERPRHTIERYYQPAETLSLSFWGTICL